ncbi:MAG: type IV pilus secretin PilQ [Gammaproteobacteria bacterium]|nr:type IV pilus secretin PilQ [Gammaproteobacteria bacterium]
MFRLVVWSLLISLMSAVPMLSVAAGNILQDISVSSLPGNVVEITLTAQDPVAMPASFTTDSPARIAVDLQGMKSALARKSQAVGIGMVRSVTAVEAGDRTRVVVNLADAASHDIKVAGNQVVVRINAGTAQITAATPESVVTKQVNAAMLPSNGGKGIDNVDFRRGNDGEGRILITLGDPLTVADLREEGGKVVLDFLDATLPERLMRKFDVSDFATPVKMFEVTSEGNNVHMEITASGDYEHLAYQANNMFAIEFRPLTSAQKEKLQKERLVYTGERLSLNFQQIEVRAVLQLLADFTDLNLVTSDSVTGSITLRLQNVPWDQALEIILKAKGLSMRKNDNVVMVAPTEEIAAREKLELESQQQIEELAPLHSEYVQINYAKAADIAALLKSEGNQLLTPSRGNVTVDERTNTLLVRDTQTKLEDIHRLVKKLDVPVRQVLIESRVVVASDDFAKDIGVRFGFNRAYSEKVGGNEIMIAGGKDGHVAFEGYDFGTWMDGGVGIIDSDNSDNHELLVNLPSVLGGDRGGAVNLLVGKIGSFLLELELSAMQTEGKGELISSPRVITSDRNTAIIKAGKEIPYLEASSSGAATIAFKEAVLKLEVTPQITPDDHVIMDLIINKDEPDFVNALNNVPSLDTNEIETSVLVDNGETVVLGGVFERIRTNTTERIPFFGDLPYVGFMFKQNAEKDNNTELLIFVTPKILKETIGMR